MEVEHIQFRVENTYFKVYKRPHTYFASIYGQLPLPFDNEEDSLEHDTLIDMVIGITLKYCRGVINLQVFDKSREIWLDF